MSSTLVLLVYGGAAVLALAFLFFFHAKHWYWHGASVLIALGIGLIPIPVQYASPATDLTIGALVVFLLFWGLLAPLFRRPLNHREKHA
ncbi:MAG: hypothetical protein SFV54_17070 [Bryobacteraceae bacterium]|nr:hypothetical protein [Bryobacteraceae bacterium]